jgi:hypothetical protein
MGNILITDSCCKKNVKNFHLCESIDEVHEMLLKELHYIHEKVLYYTKQNGVDFSIKTFNRDDKPTNIRETTLREKQFYYYLKLQIVLVHFKGLIEENTIPDEAKGVKSGVDSEYNPNRKMTKRLSLKDLRQLQISEEEKEEIERAEKKEKEHQKNVKNLELSEFLGRKGNKSKTAKELFRIRRTIHLKQCVELLNDIFLTEESLDEKELNSLERNLEIRLFDMTLN